NDLSVFKEDYNPATPTLTLEVIEDTEEVYCIKITECLWADCFRKADAAELGCAAVCYGDAPFARAVNPRIDLELEGTLMEGKPYCKLRYYVKP
ncbi:MAG: L-2-amino-thiazoline-4-carboxylic acid hydrolase, partial [Anaerolineaceae bacterium]